jgi:hypothetical protein
VIYLLRLNRKRRSTFNTTIIILPSCKTTAPLSCTNPSTEVIINRPITPNDTAKFWRMMARLARLSPTATRKLTQVIAHQGDIGGFESYCRTRAADGAFDVLELWRHLPARVSLITRTARNRALYWLPQLEPGPGGPASYGDKAPHPADWLHAGLRNWPKPQVLVRGKSIQMRYQLLGPFVRAGLPERPLFLLVVKGMHRLVGKKKPRYQHRGPPFYLISAVKQAKAGSCPGLLKPSWLGCGSAGN